MAMCSKCKANVGCGCQLKQGLCGACYSAATKKVEVKDIKTDKNVITKTS